jgi:hypothetical protein
MRATVSDIPAAVLAAAWVLTAAWFALMVAVSDGFLPGAALLWSPPALLAAGLTSSWLDHHGAPVRRGEAILAGGVWLLLLLAIVPLWVDRAAPRGYEWFVYEMSPLYGVFPPVLAFAATLRILRTPGRTPARERMK